MHPPADKPARARDGGGRGAVSRHDGDKDRVARRIGLSHLPARRQAVWLVQDRRRAGYPPRTRRPERGAAVVDFVMVGALTTVFFLAVVQLALVLHVRNTLIDAAASGARYGTLADRGAGDATSLPSGPWSASFDPFSATGCGLWAGSTLERRR